MLSNKYIATTSYDTLADTFYFTVSADKPKRYVEDIDGLLWRYTLDGDAVGVTVQAYGRLWSERKLALAEKIAGPLSFSVAEVEKRLPKKKAGVR